MVSYKIEIKPSAEKELEELPQQIIPKVVSAIQGLSDTPYPNGVKKLAGFERTYRIRVGDYRILDDIFEKKLIIQVIRRFSGLCRERGRIWGCERAYARSHPQIRVSTTGIPKEPIRIRHRKNAYK